MNITLKTNTLAAGVQKASSKCSIELHVKPRKPELVKSECFLSVNCFIKSFNKDYHSCQWQKCVRSDATTRLESGMLLANNLAF